MSKQLSESQMAEVPVMNRQVLPTLNLSWVLATSICIWFLFIHAPPVLLARNYIEPMFYLHLFGAYSIYLTCAHNTLLTPSTLGGSARPFHIWVGRVGLVLGVIGFVTGFIITWFIRDAMKELGFSIGITYGGVAQMQLQFTGYRAIRRYKDIKIQIESGAYKNTEEKIALEEEEYKHLSDHIFAMIKLFVLACGIPAIIRVGETIGNQYLPALFVFVYCLSYFWSKTVTNKIKRKYSNNQNDFRSEDSTLTQYSSPLYNKD